MKKNTYWTRNRCSMWKTYSENEKQKLNMETRILSLSQARYEIHVLAGGKIQVEVRCRKDSKIYGVCKSLTYDYY